MKRSDVCLYTAICSEVSSAEEIIGYAEKLSVGGVELMNFCRELKQPDMAEARRLGAMARERSLKIPCFSAAVDFLTKPDAVQTLQGYAQICSELEIPYLHHTIAKDFTVWDLSDREREDRFQRCLEAALDLCDYARSLGVRTLIEDQGFVFNGAENCLRLCGLSDEKIGIVADVGNCLFVDEQPEDFIRAAGKRICHAHLKDYLVTGEPHPQRKSYRTKGGKYLTDALIGEGSIDYAAVMEAFRRMNYQGMYALECPGIRTIEEANRILDRIISGKDVG